jgi:hypothetical protein
MKGSCVFGLSPAYLLVDIDPLKALGQPSNFVKELALAWVLWLLSQRPWIESWGPWGAEVFL